MSNPADPHIRWLIRRDLDFVLEIERNCFGADANSEKRFHDWLCARNIIGMVCELQGEENRIGGFMIYALEKGLIELLHFAVNPSDQRRGIGAAMIFKVLGKLDNRRRNRILVDVPETSLPFLLFLKRWGFRAERMDGDSIRMVHRLAKERREPLDVAAERMLAELDTGE